MGMTEHEAEQVGRANASGKTPVAFVHGLWLLPSSWDPWVELFEDSGYTALTPGWPDDPETVEEAKAHPEVFAGKSVGDVADYIEAILEKLDKKPAVIGHSFGALVALEAALRCSRRAVRTLVLYEPPVATHAVPPQDLLDTMDEQVARGDQQDGGRGLRQQPKRRTARALRVARLVEQHERQLRQLPFLRVDRRVAGRHENDQRAQTHLFSMLVGDGFMVRRERARCASYG